jgi:hypothetical protein
VPQNGQGLLIIACGALAHEITALKRANGWGHVDVRCLPADLHNRPERIPAAVRALIDSSRPHYRSIFVAYADCGTGGLLDAVLKEEGVERIPGAHCYEFFATAPTFAALAEAIKSWCIWPNHPMPRPWIGPRPPRAAWASHSTIVRPDTAPWRRRSDLPSGTTRRR